ncbi:MAG: hypothetical protein ACLR9P_04395 [Escherichia coli]
MRQGVLSYLKHHHLTDLGDLAVKAGSQRADVDGLQHHDPTGLLRQGARCYPDVLPSSQWVAFVLSGAWQLGVNY